MIYILYIVCQQLIIYNNQIDCNNENRTLYSLFRSSAWSWSHENDQGLVQTAWIKIGYSAVEIVCQHLKHVTNISVTKIDKAREITFLISLITKIFVQKIFSRFVFLQFEITCNRNNKMQAGKL